ncbi:odorant receptor 67c-like [Condylostylus longicornis]|uniref:odorant receptor 67c-like n=1 Tax=Condylostylus longicornis TaxID=2530218 RepID=UPI00244E46FB|nr:odorant receptor 67c-like [Condylostylus longicornis]
MNKLRTFKDFTRIPTIFYSSIGMQPHQNNSVKSFLSNFLFYFGEINLNICVVGEFIYLYFAIGSFSTFLEATALAPCIGFCLVSDFKMIAIWFNKNLLLSMMKELTDIFPKTLELQNEFKVIKYEKTININMIPFAALYMILIWTFNLMNLVTSTWKYLFMNMEFKPIQPYFIWYPFNENSPISFPIIYLLQCHAGYIAAVGTLATDLLLCCIVIQLSMHFDYLSYKIETFEPTYSMDDMKILNGYIKHHTKCLRLAEQINQMFGVSLFLNFFTSTIIICLVGFQVTAGVGTTDLIKYCLFLISSLIQVFLLCYYGTVLIDASSNISNATYNSNWVSTSLKYQKSLLLIIQRSQKPAILDAPIYHKISLDIFTTVVSLSYQFFTLLKTMYSEE